jgi:hypothetical protein
MADVFEFFRRKPEPAAEPVFDPLTFAEEMAADLLYRFSLDEAISITGRAHNLLVRRRYLERLAAEHMTIDPHRRYGIIPLPAGPAPSDAIAVGRLSDVMEYLPQSRARVQRERQLADAEKRHASRIDSIEARADSVAERERQIAERERALQADAVQRFCDSIDDLAARLDAHERAMVADALAGLPDPDHPEGLSRAQEDDLEAVHEPSHDFDKEQLEATLASEREADDVGDLPPELDVGAPPPSGNFVAPEDPAGAGTRSVSTDAHRRKFREPRPRKGRDWPAQPVAISLNEE